MGAPKKSFKPSNSNDHLEAVDSTSQNIGTRSNEATSSPNTLKEQSSSILSFKKPNRETSGKNGHSTNGVEKSKETKQVPESSKSKGRNLQKRLQEYQKRTRTESSKLEAPKVPLDNSTNPSVLPPENHDNKDLRTKLIWQLTESTYECMVCWDNIRHKNHTWSCKYCWAVFHLNCIKKWASSNKEDSTREVKLVNNPKVWRCPGCQSPQDELPSKYFCFCEKITYPELDGFSIPHSCSQPCGKKRNNDCPHPCFEQCHPGPCPPCTALSAPATCFCGSLSVQTRCGDHKNIKSCDKVCGELLGCSRHYCEELCHEGVCPPCKLEERQMCYCGENTRFSYCGVGREETSWISQGIGENSEKVYIIGSFSCPERCTQVLDCGVHKCSKPCHPIDEIPGHCNRDPASLSTCPCGKTPIIKLQATPRTACTDRIPVCGNECGKVHPNCNHKCTALCHEGECPPCFQECKRFCICKSTSRLQPCCDSHVLVCSKPCNTLKSCSKHRCDLPCCLAKGNKNDDNGLHICTKLCNKKLGCGVHFCRQLCHAGKCSPCLEASFEDLSCPCGKTIMQAPIPCGTSPPSCSFPCQRTRECGHSVLLTHNCHSSDTACPPCTVLTTKQCRCGKNNVKHIPCYRNTPSCGTMCNKKLSCGAHICKKICHDGPCLVDQEACSSECGKPRPGCGHPCKQKCHAPSMCSTGPSCEAPVQIPCACGRRKIDRICNGQPLSQRTPSLCDAECQLQIRNKRLEEALGITTKSRDVDKTCLYDPYVFIFITPTQLRWVKAIEAMINEFVLDPKRPVLRFNSMQSYQRKFLHSIAANYQVESYSIDEPPNKSVTYNRTKNTRVPLVLASEAYKNPEKYTLLEEENKDAKTTRQPINAVIIRNTELDSTVSHALRTSFFESNMQADMSMFASNIVIKPTMTQQQEMEQQEEILRCCSQVAKAALNSAHIASKVILGLVNETGAILWPKVEIVSPSRSAGSSKNVNKFSSLQETNLDKPSPVKKLISKKIQINSEAPIDSPDSKDDVPLDVVDDWMQHL